MTRTVRFFFWPAASSQSNFTRFVPGFSFDSFSFQGPLFVTVEADFELIVEGTMEV